MDRYAGAECEAVVLRVSRGSPGMTASQRILVFLFGDDMAKRSQRITRDNFLTNITRVKRELESGIDDVDELRRLLDEALHVIVRQEESRRVARNCAAEAMAAADTLIMPRSGF